MARGSALFLHWFRCFIHFGGWVRWWVTLSCRGGPRHLSLLKLIIFTSDKNHKGTSAEKLHAMRTTCYLCCGSGSRIRCFFYPRIPGREKNSEPWSGIRNEHFWEFSISFMVKNTLILWCWSGIRDLVNPGFGIRDEKNRIRIPDPILPPGTQIID